MDGEKEDAHTDSVCYENNHLIISLIGNFTFMRAEEQLLSAHLNGGCVQVDAQCIQPFNCQLLSS